MHIRKGISKRNFIFKFPCITSQWRSQEFFFGGGFQKIQLRSEDREDGDLGAVAP